MSDQSPTPDNGQIIVRLGGDIVQTLSLTGDVVTIGRTPNTTVSLSHPIVSRRHAEIRVEDEGVTLTDLGSSNGTLLNGERLPPHQPQLLSDGQSFQVGPYLLTYRAAKSPSRAPEADEAKEAEDLEEADEAEDPADESEAIEEPADESAEIDDVDDDEEVERAEEVDEIELPDDLPEELPELVSMLEQPLFGHPPAPPRPRHIAPAPVGPRSAYLQDLPVIYHEADFLGRFLMIFETVWEPLEYRQDHIPYYFDPRTAPAPFLPWLASWLDLPVNVHWPESRLRHLLSEAMDLFRWRGTNYGLSRMIEVCTAGPTVVTEDPESPYVIHIQVTLPAEGGVSDALLIDLIQTHKPAHVAFVLEVVRQ